MVPVCLPVTTFPLTITHLIPWASAPTIHAPRPFPLPPQFLPGLCFSPGASLADLFAGRWELTSVNQLKRLFT